MAVYITPEGFIISAESPPCKGCRPYYFYPKKKSIYDIVLKDEKEMKRLLSSPKKKENE